MPHLRPIGGPLPCAGRVSLDVFREQLMSLGLEETPEVRRVLSQSPIRFSALMKALISGTQLPDGVIAGSNSQKVRMNGVN